MCTQYGKGFCDRMQVDFHYLSVYSAFKCLIRGLFPKHLCQNNFINYFKFNQAFLENFVGDILTFR